MLVISIELDTNVEGSLVSYFCGVIGKGRELGNGRGGPEGMRDCVSQYKLMMAIVLSSKKVCLPVTPAGINTMA